MEPPAQPLYPPPGASAPAPGTGQPPKASVAAILSMVFATAPLVLWIVPQVGFFATVAGAILAIVFGAVGLHKAKWHPERYGGRTLALVGLILGICELVLMIVLVILLILFVAALVAACGSAAAGSGSSSQCAAPAALVAARRGERHGWGRWLLAHHPDCDWYENDVVRVASLRLCVGCVTSIPVASAALGILVLSHPPVAWWVWASVGLLVGSVQFVSLAGWTRSRATKVAVKAALGSGLAFTVFGVWTAPWPLAVRGAVIVAGWLAALLLMTPRTRRMAREATEHGHGIVA
jgi:hypothetical protein